VSRPVIYDAGGYWGLQERALPLLAGMDQPPWRTAAWDAYDVPNRDGVVLAWEHAKRWAQRVNPG
jgi:hypothetical protein